MPGQNNAATSFSNGSWGGPRGCVGDGAPGHVAVAVAVHASPDPFWWTPRCGENGRQGEGMVHKSKRRFTSDFKAHAVELVRVSGKSATEVAKDLGISTAALCRWI